MSDDSQDGYLWPMPYNKEQRYKLTQMLLYFMHRTPHRHLDTLYALCYFADFDHFELHGRSISGCTYRKMPGRPRSNSFDAGIVRSWMWARFQRRYAKQRANKRRRK